MKNSGLVVFALFCICFLSFSKVKAQAINVLVPALPTLLINDNAQTSGMGEIGVVATEHNYNAAYFQNPALLARNKKVIAGFATYTPYLRALIPNWNIYHLGLIYAPDSINAFSYSMSYNNINSFMSFGPWDSSEMQLFNSFRYARVFSEKFSVGIGYKHISYQEQFIAGKRSNYAHAADIGADYRIKKVISEEKSLRYDFGASALNLGPKTFHGSGLSRNGFMPAVLNLGVLASLEHKTPSNNIITLSLGYQAQKLLVPTPPIYDPFIYPRILAGRNPNDINALQGILGSFNDAPGIPIIQDGDYVYNPDGTIQIEKGSVFKEELNEIIHQFGFEARYYFASMDLALAFRSGYFHQHLTKGNKKFVTTGLGVQWKSFGLDLAYYAGINRRHPMANTILTSLSYQLVK